MKYIYDRIKFESVLDYHYGLLKFEFYSHYTLIYTKNCSLQIKQCTPIFCIEKERMLMVQHTLSMVHQKTGDAPKGYPLLLMMMEGEETTSSCQPKFSIPLCRRSLMPSAQRALRSAGFRVPHRHEKTGYAPKSIPCFFFFVGSFAIELFICVAYPRTTEDPAR